MAAVVEHDPAAVHIAVVVQGRAAEDVVVADAVAAGATAVAVADETVAADVEAAAVVASAAVAVEAVVADAVDANLEEEAVAVGGAVAGDIRLHQTAVVAGRLPLAADAVRQPVVLPFFADVLPVAAVVAKRLVAVARLPVVAADAVPLLVVSSFPPPLVVDDEIPLHSQRQLVVGLLLLLVVDAVVVLVPFVVVASALQLLVWREGLPDRRSMPNGVPRRMTQQQQLSKESFQTTEQQV